MTRKIEGSADMAAFRARSGFAPTMSRSRRTAILIAALLAFVWQSFITQTHEHFRPTVAALQFVKVGEPNLRATTGQPSRDNPADCPICRGIAHAGAYLTPALPMVFLATEAVAASHAVIPPSALTLSAPSHAWRSRAPPALLQA